MSENYKAARYWVVRYDENAKGGFNVVSGHANNNEAVRAYNKLVYELTRQGKLTRVGIMDDNEVRRLKEKAEAGI